MRFVKVIFGSLLAIFALVFLLENRAVLEHAVQLRFDIYLLNLQTTHIPLWVLILFSFFLGVFTAALYGIYELFKQRQTIRQLRHNLDILGEELKRAEVTVGKTAGDLKRAGEAMEQATPATAEPAATRQPE